MSIDLALREAARSGNQREFERLYLKINPQPVADKVPPASSGWYMWLCKYSHAAVDYGLNKECLVHSDTEKFAAANPDRGVINDCVICKL